MESFTSTQAVSVIHTAVDDKNRHAAHETIACPFVSKSYKTLLFNAGLSVTEKIFTGKDEWDSLFRPSDFFQKYKYVVCYLRFLQFLVVISLEKKNNNKKKNKKKNIKTQELSVEAIQNLRRFILLQALHRVDGKSGVGEGSLGMVQISSFQKHRQLVVSRCWEK